MTIKQNGGVFGRNPTFNDVTIEGQLTFDGDIDINSDLKVDGDLDVTGTATFTGEIAANGGIALGDNDKATFGAGDDLQIYSDGANSIIHETDATGNLIIKASNINLQNSGGTATLAQFVDGGKSSLRYSGSEKLATTATGIDVTGSVVADGIGFSNAPSASELLDDYEEGVFTATLAPATSGTITLVSTANELAYTKVGRQVFINGLLIVDSVSSPVGASVKLNLPFTSANLGDGAGRSAGVSVQNTSGAYLLTPIYSFEAVVEAEIIFDASTVTAGHRFYVSLSYITA